MATDRIAELIRRTMTETPDFPKPGILFRDLAPLFADAAALRDVATALVGATRGPIDVVAGVEARGFVLGAAAAMAGDVGLIAVRKAGKLPGAVLSESYDLEYGTATIEVVPGIAPAGSRVLIVDDVLATGGTLAATVRLVRRAGWTVAGIAVVIELAELGGRAALLDDPELVLADVPIVALLSL